MNQITDDHQRPSVSIHAATQGVCFLCAAQGPIFETSTECGRLIRVPLCSQDLFTIVTAQQRGSASPRVVVRGRSRRSSRNRDSLPFVEDHPLSDGDSTANGTPS